MPVNGIIYASRLFPFRVETMEFDSDGYLEPEEIIITENAIILLLQTKVISLEEIEEDEVEEYIHIHRIGKALTENDFLLTIPPFFEYSYFIANDNMFLLLQKDKTPHIVFHNCNIVETNTEKNTIEEEVQEDLKSMLEDALAREDYNEANRIQLLIENKEVAKEMLKKADRKISFSF